MSCHSLDIDAMVRLAIKKFPMIYDDLEKNNAKTKHWIWYVMPTSKAGNSQPDWPKIVIPCGREAEWVSHLETYCLKNDWVAILKRIAKLTSWPRIDKGRLNIFFKVAFR